MWGPSRQPTLLIWAPAHAGSAPPARDTVTLVSAGGVVPIVRTPVYSLKALVLCSGCPWRTVAGRQQRAGIEARVRGIGIYLRADVSLRSEAAPGPQGAVNAGRVCGRHPRFPPGEAWGPQASGLGMGD